MTIDPQLLLSHHLVSHAERLFPDAQIDVTYEDEGETIHLSVDGNVFTFECGSDDDDYVFVRGNDTFHIPLMDDTADEREFDVVSGGYEE